MPTPTRTTPDLDVNASSLEGWLRQRATTVGMAAAVDELRDCARAAVNRVGHAPLPRMTRDGRAIKRPGQ